MGGRREGRGTLWEEGYTGGDFRYLHSFREQQSGVWWREGKDISEGGEGPSHGPFLHDMISKSHHSLSAYSELSNALAMRPYV